MTKIVKKLKSEQPRQTGEKTHRILDAARNRLMRFGFDKVTMDDVADDLGMVKGGLYYYFPTKESLFRAVVVDEQQKFGGSVEGMIRSGLSPAEMLRQYATMRLQFFRRMVNISIHDARSRDHVSSTMRELFDSFEQTELNYIQHIIAAGRKSGEFTVANPGRTAKLLLHVLQGLRLRALRGSPMAIMDDGAYPDLETEVQLLIDVVLFGILRRT